MRFSILCSHRSGLTGVETRCPSFGFQAVRAVACLVFLSCAILCGQQAASPDSDKPQGSREVSPPAKVPDPPPQKQNPDLTRAEREKQIVDDNARLLKLATDLKIEVHKNTFNTLSIAIIRKATEIEKLAHSVRKKMKVNVEAAK